ncbi:MAG: HU family DNA-binding protein [Deltaproteobacteria bacterium]|nr:HU family DNA-binding protein [Deltaproteobacteria bacterium]
MTKADLVELILKHEAFSGMSKRAANVMLDVVFDNLSKAIKKDKRFTFPGFGTFTVRKRSARTGRNPKTGVEIKIPAGKTVLFKPAPAFKDFL